jgi:hypothetical protein
MLRRSGFRAAVLLLGILMTATPAAVAKPMDRSPWVGSPLRGVFGPLWEALTSLFAAPQSMSASACGERGSIMDPNGCPQVPASETDPDRGSIMDPDG